ncbi:hypothetical protein Pfra02_08800 [Pseudomonas fragi]|nr:hypothetical protein Pfra02_08800 [Pseudomonas fragi]
MLATARPVAVAISRIRAVLKGLAAAVEADIDCLEGVGSGVKYRDCRASMSLSMSKKITAQTTKPLAREAKGCAGAALSDYKAD